MLVGPGRAGVCACPRPSWTPSVWLTVAAAYMHRAATSSLRVERVNGIGGPEHLRGGAQHSSA